MTISFKRMTLVILLPVLCGCGSVPIDATCTIGDWTVICRNFKQSTQDLLATGVAEDEKPVYRPFARPLQRLEEDAP